MKKILNKILRVIIHWAYPQFKRREGYLSYGTVFKRYFLMQKIIGFNRSVPWPVHFTSLVYSWDKIEKGICCDPGDNIGIYINASGGLKLGNNVAIGPHTSITATNHNKYDHRKSFPRKIVIGDNVWIGANCSILAGVTIGNNVVIGAGCAIRQDIPSDTIVVTSANCLEFIPKKRDYEWDCTKEKLM